MGMFDNVIPECPLPDEAAKHVQEWQTKSFEQPFLHKYRITAEGRLLGELVHYEDRSDPTAPEGSIAALAGCMTAVHDGWEDTNYDGVLNFYGTTTPDWQGEWVEYDATFKNGQLEKIERMKSYWEAVEEERQRKLGEQRPPVEGQP